MGFAELIPGISGGTIAFLSGIYEELLTGISSFHPGNFLSLFRGRWETFNKNVQWRFILILLSGMFFSVLLMAHLIHALLNNEIARSYLFAFFFGLILASCYLSFRRVKSWSLGSILCLLCGILFSLFLAMQRFHAHMETGFDFFLPDFFLTHFFWLRGSLILAGMAGITAMLLPGISGSYILALLGFYPLVIASLANPFNAESLVVLTNVGCGIIVGALLFSRAIRYIFVTYHNYTVATLTGFIMGATASLWPFWSYKTLSGNNNLQITLIPLEPYLPSLTELHTWGIFTTVALAAAIAVMLEMICVKIKKEHLPHDKLHDANTTLPPEL